jgi:acrylyl-CoA reductase (NADPH)
VGTFKAIRIDKAEKGTTAALTQFDEAELMEGDVTIRVEYSALNYKDGLAVTGKAPVVRRFPMIAGIDLAGTVEQSSHPQWKAGDKVICTGWGMSPAPRAASARSRPRCSRSSAITSSHRPAGCRRPAISGVWVRPR